MGTIKPLERKAVKGYSDIKQGVLKTELGAKEELSKDASKVENAMKRVVHKVRGKVDDVDDGR